MKGDGIAHPRAADPPQGGGLKESWISPPRLEG